MAKLRVLPASFMALLSASTTIEASICTQKRHDALKLDQRVWQSMEYVGIQEGCQEYNLELRNCTCGSTLAKRIPIDKIAQS